MAWHWAPIRGLHWEIMWGTFPFTCSPQSEAGEALALPSQQPPASLRGGGQGAKYILQSALHFLLPPHSEMLVASEGAGLGLFQPRSLACRRGESPLWGLPCADHCWESLPIWGVSSPPYPSFLSPSGGKRLGFSKPGLLGSGQESPPPQGFLCRPLLWGRGAWYTAEGYIPFPTSCLSER